MLVHVANVCVILIEKSSAEFHKWLIIYSLALVTRGTIPLLVPCIIVLQYLLSNCFPFFLIEILYQTCRTVHIFLTLSQH